MEITVVGELTMRELRDIADDRTQVKSVSDLDFFEDVGNDWDTATGRTLGPNQTMVHQLVDTTTGDTYWLQATAAPIPNACTAVTLNCAAPTRDRWNFAIVEIVK